MLIRLRSIQVLAGLVVAAGVAHADATADGTSSVGLFLYNVGDNNNGGTGSQITETLFSNYNANFIVGDAGPGFESQFMGGGFLDDGFDAGVGAAWSYFGENQTTGDVSSNFGGSSASNTMGTINEATEDTYDRLVFKITNTSSTKNEWVDLDLSDGVESEVDLDDSANEFGLDEAVEQFGYSNSQGAFTGNYSTNAAYAETGDGLGEGLGSDDFDFVENNITDFYSARLKPGQTLYFTVATENYSFVGAQVTTPSPAAVIPFAVGLLGARRRRKNR